MKTLLLTLLTLTLSIPVSQSDTTVYICHSKSSKAYHLDQNCFALKNCTHEIKTVSKYDAVNTYGRKLCGHDD
jgi:micrococcal nuclease